MIHVDEFNYKYLPYSGRRYIVSRTGRIFTREGVELQTLFTNDSLQVELTWLDGTKNYIVGMLVLVTFANIYLPDHLLTMLLPLHLDEDPLNNNLTNLDYRFKGGLLPYEKEEGFYYVPGYTKYVINAEGILITAATGKIKTWTREKPDLTRNSKGGYYYTRVVITPGVNSVLLRHRALCLTFKPISETKDIYLIVNHLDGVPGNDLLDNLEWTTYTKNNQHALENGLISKGTTVVEVRHLKSGEEWQFPNIQKAARHFRHIGTLSIRHRLTHSRNVLYSDYLQFRRAGEAWPTLPDNAEVVDSLLCRKMAARNIFTGEITLFDSFEEGSRILGIDKQTIAIHIRDKQLIPFKGYNFSWFDESLVWPTHSDFNKQAYLRTPVRTPDPIIIQDVSTGEEHLRFDAREAAEFLGISRPYVNNLLNTGKKYQNKFVLRFRKLKDNLTVPLDWKV